MDLSLAIPRWQRWTVYAIVGATALLFWSGAPDTFALPKATILWLGALVLIALSVAAAAWERIVRVPRSRWALALVVFLAAVVVTTLASPTLALSVVGEYNRYTGLLSYASFAVIGLVVLRTFDVDEAATLLRLIVVVTTVAALHGLLQKAEVDPFDLVPAGVSVTGPMGNANIFAGLLAIGVPAAAWQALSATAGRPWRVSAALAGVVSFSAAVLSGSFQGPVAALPGGLLVVAVWLTTEDGRHARAVVAGRARGRWVLVGLAGVAVVALVGGAAMTFPEGLRGGFLERGDFWRAAVSMFSDNPVLGVGFDTYGQHFLAERPAGHAARLGFIQAESPHNVPLNLLAGGGLVVVVPWLAVVGLTGWSLVRGLRRLDGEERLLLGGLGGAWLAYMLQAIVSFDVPALGVLHLVLAASIVAIATPVRWHQFVLPGAVPRRLSGRGSRTVVPGSTIGALIALALLTLIAAVWATRPLRADLSSAAAQDAFEAGDAQGAADSLQRATELAPWQGRYWLLRSQLAEATSEVFASIEYAIEALEREPGSSQYALLAGRLTARYRSPEEAAPLFELALQRDPHNPGVLTAVARYEASTGDMAAAHALLDRAQGSTADPFGLQMAIAEVARMEGDLEAARAAYEAALEITSGNSEAIIGLREVEALLEERMSS